MFFEKDDIASPLWHAVIPRIKWLCLPPAPRPPCCRIARSEQRNNRHPRRRCHMRSTGIGSNKPLRACYQFRCLSKAQFPRKNDSIGSLRNNVPNCRQFTCIVSSRQNNLQTRVVQTPDKSTPIIRRPSLVGISRHEMQHDVRHVKTSLCGQLCMRLRHIRCLCGLSSCAVRSESN